MKDKYRRDHKVGDIITIREWDDMYKEFNGCARVPLSFTQMMRKFCGHSYHIIKSIPSGARSNDVFFLKDSNNVTLNFEFSSEMFKESLYTKDFKKELKVLIKKFNGGINYLDSIEDIPS